MNEEAVFLDCDEACSHEIDDAPARRPGYGEGRQALVDAAIRLVAREGVPKLTYRSLTAEAGVSQGSLRHHFPHLIGVLEAALESCLEVSKAYMEQPRERLQGLFSHTASLMHDRPEIPAFLAEVYIVARHTPELLEIVRRHQQHYRDRIEAALAGVGLPVDDALVDAVLAIGDGLMYQRVIFGEGHEQVTRRQVAGSQRLLMALLFKERVGDIGRHLPE